MRKYNNLPDPTNEPEAFNQYLRDNNEVVEEIPLWIIIKNSYIKDQLVAFCKLPVKTMLEYTTKTPATMSEQYANFIALFLVYEGKHIYINADKDKSVLKRLHFHIKI